MKVIGVDLPRDAATSGSATGTIVVLGSDGRIGERAQGLALPEIVSSIARFAADEPFLLGVNLPVVVANKPVKSRPIENLVRRRFGHRLPPGGRAALTADSSGVPGEALMAGLAATGQPCLPYPDRDRRRPGMVETYPALILKTLLWIESPLGESREADEQQILFRAYTPAAYRAAQIGARTTWAEQAASLDFVLRLIEPVDGFDIGPSREALGQSASLDDVEAAAALFDAALIAGMARRYIETPESCLFLGDTDSGYVILPADRFVRGLASETRPTHGRLFPTASLKNRLGPGATIRSADLLDIPGRPHRLEARFDDPPRYEFKNVDEMLWWKHARHLGGPPLVTEGLERMAVTLDGEGSENASPLFLVRSRHRTLSYRFDPPQAWRTRMSTRDQKVYTFSVILATYETSPT